MDHVFFNLPLFENRFPLREKRVQSALHPSQLKTALQPLGPSTNRLVAVAACYLCRKPGSTPHRCSAVCDRNTLLIQITCIGTGRSLRPVYKLCRYVRRRCRASYLIYNAQKLLNSCQFPSTFRLLKTGGTFWDPAGRALTTCGRKLFKGCPVALWEPR